MKKTQWSKIKSRVNRLKKSLSKKNELVVYTDDLSSSIVNEIVVYENYCSIIADNNEFEITDDCEESSAIEILDSIVQYTKKAK